MCDDHTLVVTINDVYQLDMGFSQTIRSELRLRKWTTKRFSDEIRCSPEHARKVRGGIVPPGPDLTLRIADKLEIDPEELQREVDIAKWEKLHHRKPPNVTRPDMTALESLWTELSEDQREYMVCVASCLIMKKKTRAA